MRAKDEAIELGQVSGTLADRGQAIVDASLTGKITPNQASTLMQALMAQVRVVEADELAARVEALEHKVNRPK
jgi:polyhydroxyalkanoate synthesis regulator phasin